MKLHINYSSSSFPATHKVGIGTLDTSWNELLWSAITIGRPSTYHVFRHGPASFHEAIFRLALIRMAVEQNAKLHLQRTDAFAALDPTEKGMVSYFLGMTVCKLFAHRLLNAPWLLHLDVFRHSLNPVTLGRSRPDLVAQDINGDWHAFESKGRSSAPSSDAKDKAKAQALRLVSVHNQACTLHVGALTFFKSDALEFFWRDPEPVEQDAIQLPDPRQAWRYYYEPALQLASPPPDPVRASEREMADVNVQIHPTIRELLDQGMWQEARQAAHENRQALASGDYPPDGVRVVAGQSWYRPFVPRESL